MAFREARGDFGGRSAISSRNTMPPADWWSMFGNSAPTLQKLAMRILSQTASSSACERNWSTFSLIHTKLRNRLAYKKLEKLVFCSYNMKLMLRDRKAEMDNVVAEDPLDMVQRSLDRMGQQDETDEMLNWIRSTHMDDQALNPDPSIAQEARRHGVDVDRVLSEEVHSPTLSDSHHSPSGSSDDDHGPAGGGSALPASGGIGSTSSSDFQHGGGGGGGGTSQTGGPQLYGGEGYTHAEPHDPPHQRLRDDFPDMGYDSSYNRQRDMSDGMSISGSNDVDLLSQYFGSMSFTPESSETSFPIDYTRPRYEASYDASYSYGYPPPQEELPEVIVPVPVIVQPQADWRTYLGSDGRLINVQAQPGFPLYSIYVGLDQYNYDTHLRTYMSTYSNDMTWYEYCQLQNQQPRTFVPPRHSSFY